MKIRTSEKSQLEEEFARQVKLFRITPPVRQFKFHPIRKWRSDFAWPAHRLIVEIEGGVFSRGRHVRPGGFMADVEKYNALAMLEPHWTLLRFAGPHVTKGIAIKQTMEKLAMGVTV